MNLETDGSGRSGAQAGGTSPMLQKRRHGPQPGHNPRQYLCNTPHIFFRGRSAQAEADGPSGKYGRHSHGEQDMGWFLIMRATCRPGGSSNTFQIKADGHSFTLNELYADVHVVGQSLRWVTVD